MSRPADVDFNVRSPVDSDSENCCSHQESTVVRQSEQREFVPESGWYKASNLREENGEKLAYNLLSETFEQHEQSFLKQLLSSKGLSLSWADIVSPLMHDIVNIIRPGMIIIIS